MQALHLSVWGVLPPYCCKSNGVCVPRGGAIILPYRVARAGGDVKKQNTNITNIRVCIKI